MELNNISRRVLAFRELSVFQPMCPKFDGFRRIAPEQDFGMDSNEPFLTALQMFNAKKDKQ